MGRFLQVLQIREIITNWGITHQSVMDFLLIVRIMTFSFDKCYALNHLILKNAFHLVENGRKMLAISHV